MREEIDFREFARAVGTVMDYAQNDIIFREDDPPKFMYILLSGSVEISSHGKVIGTIHKGNALGILSLLDERPRTIHCLREGKE